MNRNFKILIVDDDPDILFATNRVIKSAGFETCEAIDGASCLKALREHAPALILLDVELPDADGRDIAGEIKAQPLENHPYIVIITGKKISSDDQVEGLDAGADGYITRPIENKELLARVRVFIRLKKAELKRNETIDKLHSLALADELTGLHNRRGFFVAAKRQQEIARQEGKNTILIFADLDGLKKTNDTMGHKEGDHALIETSRIIKNSFRDTDILARIGGDEFVIFVIDDTNEQKGDMAKKLMHRLQENVEMHNANSKTFMLSLSLGATHCGPKDFFSLDKLLKEADEAMYKEKQRKYSCKD